eukprot:256026-Chlamydomonas_euryale.AAC.1
MEIGRQGICVDLRGRPGKGPMETAPQCAGTAGRSQSRQVTGRSQTRQVAGRGQAGPRADRWQADPRQGR